MKKQIAVILVLVILMGALFCACGKPGKEDEQDSTQVQGGNTTEITMDAKTLEVQLLSQPLFVVAKNYYVQNETDKVNYPDVLQAFVCNSSGATIKNAVVAFVAWDANGNPVKIKGAGDAEEPSYIKKATYSDINVADEGIFGETSGLPISADCSVSKFNAIAYSYETVDGETWQNPLYADFCKLYEGVKYSDILFEKEEDTTKPTTAGGENSDTTAQNPSSDNQNTTQGGNQNGGQSNAGADSKAYRIDKCQQVFQSGQYYMVVTMINDGVADDPMTMAVKNGNIYMATQMDDMEAKMLYLKSENKMYLILDFMKKYCDVPEDMMGDLDMSQVTDQLQIQVENEITVSQAEFDGQNVICESYVKSDGTVYKFYFDQNDNFIGREDIEPDGTVSVMKISGFSGSVSDSYFEFPDGYKYMNIGWILSMMG